MEKLKSYKYDMFDFYLLVSFLSSLVLCGGLFLTSDDFFSNAILPIGLVVGNYFFFINFFGFSRSLQDQKVFPVIFLFQTFSLIGMSYMYNNAGGLYLAVVSFSSGLLFVNLAEKRQEMSQMGAKLLTFISLSVLSSLLFLSLPNGVFMTGVDWSILGSFLFWGVGLSYFWNMELKTLNELGIHRINYLDNLLPIDAQSDYHKEEKLFFHDLINQTHGLQLFLSNRISAKKEIGVEDCEKIRDEIKLMQTMIKDFFGYHHKDLRDSFELVSFDFAFNEMKNIINSFLPSSTVKSEYEFKGRISSDKSVEIKNMAQVHYPSFYRIMTNLVKNISEEQASEVHFLFDYSEEGLSILVRNKLSGKSQQVNLPENSQTSDVNYQTEIGLGLKSIKTICHEQKGNFNFYKDASYWVSSVFLPDPSKVSKEIFSKAS